MMRRFGKLWLIMTLAAVVVAGCEQFQRGERPPDYLKVSATAQPLPREFYFDIHWLAALNKQLETTGQAEPAAGEQPVENILMARAQARREALGEFATELLALAPPEAATIEMLLVREVEQVEHLNELLQTNVEVTYPENPGQVLAVATLSADELTSLVRETLEPGSVRYNDLSPAQQLAFRREAYSSALEEAKSRLRQEIMEMPLREGREQTVGEGVSNDPTLVREIEALIFFIQPDTVNYADDGAATVEVFFNRNLVRDLFEESSPGWWPF